jgi:hypothetical protein
MYVSMRTAAQRSTLTERETVIMPLTFLAPTCSYPTLPNTIMIDDVPHVRREITARNVRPGDLTAFIDMTLPSGVGTFGIGVVHDVWSTPAGRGRRYVAPWHRRTIVTSGWRGSLRSFQMPDNTADYAHDDRVTVWRAAKTSQGPTVWDWSKLGRCARYIGNGEYVNA